MILSASHVWRFVAERSFFADVIIDGGRNGGEVVATGTPEQVAQSQNSITAKYLKKELTSPKFNK